MPFLSEGHINQLLHEYGYGLLGLVVCLEAIGLLLPSIRDSDLRTLQAWQRITSSSGPSGARPRPPPRPR